MCVTRVAKIIEMKNGKATVRFLDDSVTKEVDASMVGNIRKNSYVEVFADSVLNALTPKEAQWRKKLWIDIREKNGWER